MPFEPPAPDLDLISTNCWCSILPHLCDPIEVVPLEPSQGLPRLDVPRLADQPVRGLGDAEHSNEVQDGKRAENRRLDLKEIAC